MECWRLFKCSLFWCCVFGVIVLGEFGLCYLVCVLWCNRLLMVLCGVMLLNSILYMVFVIGILIDCVCVSVSMVCV